MSSSSVSSGVVRERGVPSKCVCGLGITIFTSKTQDNPGRRFFRCVSKRDPISWTNKKDGHLFKWVEEAIFEEMEDALPRIDIIANEVIKGKSETNVLMAEIQEMQEEALLRKKELHKCIWCLNVVSGLDRKISAL
ncbi:putative transcription factor GRF family [Arabidopsis thaliana]